MSCKSDGLQVRWSSLGQAVVAPGRCIRSKSDPIRWARANGLLIELTAPALAAPPYARRRCCTVRRLFTALFGGPLWLGRLFDVCRDHLKGQVRRLQETIG
jgi:hypothetical protein